MSLTLTIKQIRNLAAFAGLRIIDEVTNPDDQETEITVMTCPEQGIKNDDGVIAHYRHVAYFDEYPEEGMCPLGPQIPAQSERVSEIDMKAIEIIKTRIAELEANLYEDAIITNRAAAIYHLHPLRSGDPFGEMKVVQYEQLGNKGMYRQIAQWHIANCISGLKTLLGELEKEEAPCCAHEPMPDPQGDGLICRFCKTPMIP